MALIVQKYGGACLARKEKIVRLAQRLDALAEEGHQLVVVVSAMGETTDELLKMAYSVSSHPNRRELDMLLTAGERMSMSILSIALNDLGRKATSFTGSQAGILTTSGHSDARINRVTPERVEAALAAGQIVILAGFQGVHPESREVTTLGRGGSDTTAVAMAKAIRADRCEIYKEVPGFCSGDPRLVSESFCHKKLDYRSAAELCFWGAQVLHYRAIELAEKLKVPLFIGEAWKSSISGTQIGENMNFEKEQILGVQRLENCLTIGLQSSDLAEGFRKVSEATDKKGLPQCRLIASTQEDDQVRLMVCPEKEDLKAFTKCLEEAQIQIIEKQSIVSLCCFGSVQSSLPQRAVCFLAEKSITVHKVLMSSSSLSLAVPESDGEKACQILHNEFLSSEI